MRIETDLKASTRARAITQLLTALALVAMATPATAQMPPLMGGNVTSAECLPGARPRVGEGYHAFEAPGGDVVVGNLDDPAMATLPGADDFHVTRSFSITSPVTHEFALAWRKRGGQMIVTLLKESSGAFVEAFDFDVTEGEGWHDCDLGERTVSNSHVGHMGTRVMEVCRRGNNYIRLRSIAFQHTGSGVPNMAVTTLFEHFVTPGQNVVQVFAMDRAERHFAFRTPADTYIARVDSFTTVSTSSRPGRGVPDGNGPDGTGGLMMEDATGGIAPYEVTAGVVGSSAPFNWRGGPFPVLLDFESPFPGLFFGAEMDGAGRLFHRLHSLRDAGAIWSALRVDFPGWSVDDVAASPSRSLTWFPQVVLAALSGGQVAVLEVRHRVRPPEGVGFLPGTYSRAVEVECSGEPNPGEPIPLAEILTEAAPPIFTRGEERSFEEADPRRERFVPRPWPIEEAARRG
ncbi:MAG: hypothetical protein AAF447_19065 [Myxococcota bacterium]